MTRHLAILYLCSAAFGFAADQHRLLAVLAHPDDETVVGPLLAKYAAEGHAVHLITLTAGQKGTTEHARIPGGEALAAVRAKELACAASKLGLEGHTLLPFQDQGFAIGWAGEPINEAAAQVRQAIDRFRPDVVLTWGPDGGTGHPDHRAASNLTTQAFQQRSLLKHQPRKLYYVVFPDRAEPAGEWAAGRKVSEEFITTEVDCSRYLAAGQAAVECHKSQWTPQQMQAMGAAARARKGVVPLRLALTTVGAAAGREKDIFERLP